jgi:hypothetical protein
MGWTYNELNDNMYKAKCAQFLTDSPLGEFEFHNHYYRKADENIFP